MAYRFDPRIRAEKKRIEDEEAKIKQEKFEKREAERKLKEDIIRKEKEAIEKIEREKMEADLKIKLDKQIKLKEREVASGKLCELAELKMRDFHPQFDKYFMEEFCKKISIQEIQNQNEILETEEPESASTKVAAFIEKTVKSIEEEAK